jgi:alpha/beta superfamily hydrolase
MSVFAEERVTFESDGLLLEGALHQGEGKLAALILHPHPQYGGDMDSHVVFTLVERLAGDGATTLRFNFRGAGGSEGIYDGGDGEANDARAAAAYVRRCSPDGRFVLVGYSFGAAVAASIASQVEPDGLLLVSLPAMAVGRVPEGRHALVATGDRDEIAPAEALRKLASPSCQVVVIEGVDHFWWPGIDRLAEVAGVFAGNLLTEQ